MGKVCVALMRVRRAWNLLDHSGEVQLQMHNSGSISTTPVYYETHERNEMLQLMKEVVQKGTSSYENPFGADDTEALLEAFGGLATGQKRLLSEAEASSLHVTCTTGPAAEPTTCATT